MTPRPQKYLFLAILDFEASVQVNKSVGTKAHEVTEFPILLIDGADPTLPLIAEFHTFIRPTRHVHFLVRNPSYASYPSFPEAFGNLDTFLASHGATPQNTLAITCGDWDLRAMLPFEQASHGLPRNEMWTRWCNIKHAFSRLTGKKVDGMVRMLHVIEEPLVGRHHSGIDDCRNLATVARWMVQEGCVFGVTSEGKQENESDAEFEQERGEVLRKRKEEAREAAERAREAKLEAGKVPPQEMFRDANLYSAWDLDGVPTQASDGSQLTRSGVNRLKKQWKARDELHGKYLSWKAEVTK